MALRTTQQYVEVLGPGSGALRVTQQYVEVLGPAYELITPITFGDSLNVLHNGQLSVDTATAFNDTLALSGSNWLRSLATATTFGQDISVAYVGHLVTSALSLTQSAVISNLHTKSVSTNFPLTQLVALHGSVHYNISNSVAFTQQLTQTQIVPTPRTATTTLSLGQTASAHVGTLRKTVISPIAFTQQVIGHNRTITKSLSHALTLGQTTTYVGPQFAIATSQLILNTVARVPVQINKTVTTALSLGQTLSYIGPKYVSVFTALTYNQNADTRVKVRTVTTALPFNSNTSYDRLLRVSSQLTLDHSVDRGLIKESCSTQIVLTQSVRQSFHSATAITPLLLGQIAVPSSITHNIAVPLQQVPLTQTVQVIKPNYISAKSELITKILTLDPDTLQYIISYVGLDQQVICNVKQNSHLNQYLQTNHFVSVVNLKASAIAASATTTLILDHYANLGPFATAETQVNFGQSLSSFTGPDAVQQLPFDNIATVNVVRNSLQAITEIALSSGLGYSTDEDVRKQYHPFVGNKDTLGYPVPPSPDEPTLIDSDGVRFYYPFEAATIYEWITHRKPDYGNKDQLMFQRINRNTRAGRLIIFADPGWPKDTTMVMSFTALTEASTQLFLQFLDDTLGQEIGFRDWLGRIFRGVITNIQDPVVRNGIENNSITVHFEITTHEYPLDVSTPLSFDSNTNRQGFFDRQPESNFPITDILQRNAVYPKNLFDFINIQHLEDVVIHSASGELDLNSGASSFDNTATYQLN
jgi:hypothetical protein